VRGSGAEVEAKSRSLATLDRVRERRVGSAGSETERSTLTSWRSGRLGRVPSGEEGAVGQSVVCRRRSERTARIAQGAFYGR
jgi:hypothetical protein